MAFPLTDGLKSYGSASLFFSLAPSFGEETHKKTANINCTKQRRAAGVARRHGNNSFNTGSVSWSCAMRTAIPGNLSVLFAFFVALFARARVAYGSRSERGPLVG